MTNHQDEHSVFALLSISAFYCFLICVFAVPRPKPLSTVVHRTDRGRPVSHSMIVNSVMDKVAEARYSIKAY